MADPPTNGKTLEITLPWPPSVNHYWRHVGSRVLISREGRLYRKAIAAALWLHPPMGQVGLKTGRLEVSVMVHPPDHKRRDLDNMPKALLDALERGGVYENDNQVDRLIIERGNAVPDGRGGRQDQGDGEVIIHCEPGVYDCRGGDLVPRYGM